MFLDFSRKKPANSFKASEFTDFEALFWKMAQKSKGKRFHKRVCRTR